MDFIERAFHVSPDGGDGSLEVLWLAVAALALSFALLRRRVARSARRRTMRTP
jgi:hypothetical protein